MLQAVAVALLLGAPFCLGERVPIKINNIPEAPTYSYPTPTQTSSTPSYTFNHFNMGAVPGAVREPAVITLPRVYDSLAEAEYAVVADRWASLDGHCYSLRTDQYTYELCPFRNITQKGDMSAIMGLWGTWVSGGTHPPLTMQYTDGTPCSSGSRRITYVHLVCEESPAGPRISTIAEPSTCEYTVNFHVSLACPAAQPQGVTLPVASTPTTVDATGQRRPVPCRKSLEEKERRLTALQACVDHFLSSSSSSTSTSGPCAGLASVSSSSPSSSSTPASDIDNEGAGARTSSNAGADGGRSAPRRSSSPSASASSSPSPASSSSPPASSPSSLASTNAGGSASDSVPSPAAAASLSSTEVRRSPRASNSNGNGNGEATSTPPASAAAPPPKRKKEVPQAASASAGRKAGPPAPSSQEAPPEPRSPLPASTRNPAAAAAAAASSAPVPRAAGAAPAGALSTNALKKQQQQPPASPSPARATEAAAAERSKDEEEEEALQAAVPAGVGVAGEANGLIPEAEEAELAEEDDLIIDF